MQSLSQRLVAAGLLGLYLIGGVLSWQHEGFKLDDDKGLFLTFFAVWFVNALAECLPASFVRIKRATGLITLVALVILVAFYFAQTGFRWATPLGSPGAFKPDAIDLHDILVTHWYITLIVLFLPLMGLGWLAYSKLKARKR